MSAFSETEAAELAAAALAPAEAAAAATATPKRPADGAYGLLQWGPLVLALAVDHLREVIACPDVLAPLPSASPAVRSAVLLRGSVIPVLDLGAVLGLPALESHCRVIVVMRFQGRLLGLLAGAVRGMARKPAHELNLLTVATPGGTCVATHSFEIDGTVATLLDAERMATLPGVPMVAEPVAAPRAHDAGARATMLLFRLGDIPLGIDALVVDATVPRTPLVDSPLKRGLCRGIVPHHGHAVPVVDTLALLGLGESPACDETAMVVLRIGSGRIGLMIDQVQDIVQVAAQAMMPVQAVGLSAPQLFRGLLARDRQQHLLLDAIALAQHELLGSLASLSLHKGMQAGIEEGKQALRPTHEMTPSNPHAQTHPPANPGRGAPTAAGPVLADARQTQRQTRAPFLTYRVGVELASPLSQVVEILTYPAHTVPLPAGRSAVLGLFEHRGAAVPLVCLAALRGQVPCWTAEQARVLIVEEGGRRVGLVVQALCSIEHARWAEPSGTARARGVSLPPLIEVGEGGQHRTLPRVDLVELVAGLVP